MLFTHEPAPFLLSNRKIFSILSSTFMNSAEELSFVFPNDKENSSHPTNDNT